MFVYLKENMNQISPNNCSYHSKKKYLYTTTNNLCNEKKNYYEKFANRFINSSIYTIFYILQMIQKKNKDMYKQIFLFFLFFRFFIFLFLYNLKSEYSEDEHINIYYVLRIMNLSKNENSKI